MPYEQKKRLANEAEECFATCEPEPTIAERVRLIDARLCSANECLEELIRRTARIESLLT